MKIKFLKGLLILVFLIGIIGAGGLVYDEITISNICPKILRIPACYIILACFGIPFIVHLTKYKNNIYFLFTGIAFTIAFIASILEITKLAECPKTSNGHPMCYYSLVLFTTLIVLKITIIKYDKVNRVNI